MVTLPLNIVTRDVTSKVTQLQIKKYKTEKLYWKLFNIALPAYFYCHEFSIIHDSRSFIFKIN